MCCKKTARSELEPKRSHVERMTREIRFRRAAKRLPMMVRSVIRSTLQALKVNVRVEGRTQSRRAPARPVLQTLD